MARQGSRCGEIRAGGAALASAHCPNDAVIQLVLPAGFYLHGDRGMGGASLDQVFVCRAEALGGFAARK